MKSTLKETPAGRPETPDTGYVGWLTDFKGVRVLGWERRDNRWWFLLDLTMDQARAYEVEYGNSEFRRYDAARRFWVDKTLRRS